jgi:hypothetical protein
MGAELGLSHFEYRNMVLRYLGLRGGNQLEAEEKCIMRSFIICIPHKILW